jgi:hypothetical protein
MNDVIITGYTETWQSDSPAFPIVLPSTAYQNEHANTNNNPRKYDGFILSSRELYKKT